MSSSPVSVFWFRRDLRIDDNHGLYEAMKHAAGSNLIPIFIFDQDILTATATVAATEAVAATGLPRDDHRVTFIHKIVSEIKTELSEHSLDLLVLNGRPIEIFRMLIAKHKISKIFCNEDYEPYALKRDAEIANLLKKNGIEFKSYKDHVIFAKDEIVKDDGTCYRMFTPYCRKWLQLFSQTDTDTPTAAVAAPPSTESFQSKKLLPKGKLIHPSRMPSLKELGFTESELIAPPVKLSPAFLKNYVKTHDFPRLQGTSHIGPHLRFGTISIRKAVALAKKHSPTWLKEIIWREFFQQILFHYPHTVDQPYDERFKKFPWRPISSRKAREDFEAWKAGRTGYPIVDAGMREINATGFMHNRARMIVGSFLTKHLLLDWRLGERYFAEKLFDFDLASNVGNWQWVAGTGCDAAPYFRVFNPALQMKKFDPEGAYVKKWVPEAGGKDYPDPIVDHESARRRALVAFSQVKGKVK